MHPGPTCSLPLWYRELFKGGTYPFFLRVLLLALFALPVILFLKFSKVILSVVTQELGVKQNSRENLAYYLSRHTAIGNQVINIENLSQCVLCN